MGGVVGHLLYLFCRSGCQPSVVASALAFHPPIPSFYSMTIATTAEEGEVSTNVSKLKPGEDIVTQFRLADELPAVNFPNVSSYMIRSKQRTFIPLFYLQVPNSKFTMIFSHGNAADIGIMFNTFEFMAKLLKINIVGYDYSGYGTSRDYGCVQPTEKQTYQDIMTVYQWCIDKQIVQVPEKEIILYGQSVGSGPTSYLARRKPIAGVILHSPFLSGLRVITPSRLLACFDIFPNINDLPKSKAPVFIIHGERDVEVAFAHGQRLFELLPGKVRYTPWWVPERGHNDVLHGNEREFIRRVREFIDYLSQQHQQAASSPSAAPPSTTETSDRTIPSSNKNMYSVISTTDSVQ